MYVNGDGTLIMLDYAVAEDKIWANYILSKLRHDAYIELEAERFDELASLTEQIRSIKNGLTAANDQTAKTTTKEPTERITENE